MPFLQESQINEGMIGEETDQDSRLPGRRDCRQQADCNYWVQESSVNQWECCERPVICTSRLDSQMQTSMQYFNTVQDQADSKQDAQIVQALNCWHRRKTKIKRQGRDHFKMVPNDQQLWLCCYHSPICSNCLLFILFSLPLCWSHKHVMQLWASAPSSKIRAVFFRTCEEMVVLNNLYEASP